MDTLTSTSPVPSRYPSAHELSTGRILSLPKGPHPLSGTVIQQTDFDVIIEQRVSVSGRNLACAIPIRQKSPANPLAAVFFVVVFFSPLSHDGA